MFSHGMESYPNPVQLSAERTFHALQGLDVRLPPFGDGFLNLTNSELRQNAVLERILSLTTHEWIWELEGGGAEGGNDDEETQATFIS
jgi:hypothetical protein